MIALLSGCGSPHSTIQPLPVHPDAVRKACAMEVSCFTTPPIASASACVEEIENGLASGFGIALGGSGTDLARFVDCANNNGDCTSALMCASKGHGPSWCSAHPTATCDGDTLVRCVGGWGLDLFDCAQNGLHCMTKNGVALCSDGNACDPATSGTCVGNDFVYCDKTALIGVSEDCGSLVSGGKCERITTGTATITGCIPPGTASCPNTTTSKTCDGTTTVVCEYGTTYRVDCGQFANHCTPSGSFATGSCTPDASDCTPQSNDSCVGDAIQMCVNGKLQTQPCSSFGMTTCTMAPSGGPLARCM